MWFPFKFTRGRPKPTPAPSRLAIEALEDRTVPTFVPLASYAGVAARDNLTVADFNNDAIPDLIATDNTSDRVNVMLGNGDGTFQTARSSATGAELRDLGIGDFNRDGKLDIVTTTFLSDVRVQFGNGDGTFQPPRSFTLPKLGKAGQMPGGISVGDFNNDGKLDLVVAGSGPTQSSHRFFGLPSHPTYANIFLGQGDGSFRAKSTTSVGSSAGAVGVVTGDFTGDGKLDVLVSRAMSGVALMKGLGDGRLSDPVSTALGVSTSMAVADLNGDGKLDVVTGFASNGAVNTYLGNGAGSFQLAQSVRVGSNSSSLVVGDFNRDSRLDVASLDVSSSTLGLLLGNGDGTSQAPLLFSVGSNSGSLAAGDFDRDGQPDLAIGQVGSLQVLINDGNW